MENQESEFNKAVLELSGKLVTGFGLVLGAAYISGWIYTYYYFDHLNAGWVLGFYDAQTYVQVGLPWAVYCAVATGFIVVYFKRSEHIVSTARSVAGIVSSLAVALFGIMGAIEINIENTPVFRNFSAMFMGAIAAFCVASAIRALDEGKSLKDMLVWFAAGSLWMTVASPWMYAYSKNIDFKLGEGSQVSVWQNDTGTKGIMLGAVGGRLIVKDCSTHDIYIFIPDKKTAIYEGEIACEVK